MVVLVVRVVLVVLVVLGVAGDADLLAGLRTIGRTIANRVIELAEEPVFLAAQPSRRALREHYRVSRTRSGSSIAGGSRTSGEGNRQPSEKQNSCRDNDESNPGGHAPTGRQPSGTPLDRCDPAHSDGEPSLRRWMRHQWMRSTSGGHWIDASEVAPFRTRHRGIHQQRSEDVHPRVGARKYRPGRKRRRRRRSGGPDR